VSTHVQRRPLLSSHRLIAMALAALAGLIALGAVAEAADAAKRGVRVKVMTRNVYLGSPLSPALDSTSTAGLCTGAGEVLRQVDGTNPPARMRALANEIASKKPDFVGMQEVAKWSVQNPSDGGDVKYTFIGTPATTVKYDFLQLILKRLKQRGTPYRAVSVSNNFEFETPADYNDTPGDGTPQADALGCTDSEVDGRMLIRDVILARVGHGVRVSKPKHGNYHHRLVLDIAGGVGFPVLRGWESVNARVRGSARFRFVNTHLEAFDSATSNDMCVDCTYPANPAQISSVSRGSIREAQALEVVGGPAKSRLSILVGDLNSNVPGVQPGDSQAFAAVLAARFKRRSTYGPQSCCVDDPSTTLLGGSLSDFDHVVDHITAKPGRRIKKLRSAVVGRAKTAAGPRWPSDHAGVWSLLRVPRG
jgi:hypothetical protein